MSTLADYLAFAKAHPALFVNPSQGGITILLDENEIREAEAQMAQWLQTKGMPSECAQVGIAYRDQYVLLLRDAVRFPNGSLGTYIRSVGADRSTPGVVVLSVYQGQVLLIRHFRHATRTWHLGIPSGFGMPGLSSEENAKRELEEEVAAIVSRLIPLGLVHLDVHTGADYVELFFAEVESYGEVEVQEGITELLPACASV